MTEVSINSQAKLSPHFTLGEVTKSRHAEVYNIPSHVAIENLKRDCGWLEELRHRYNQRYVCGGEEDTEEPIIISSGYRSPEVNKCISP